MAFNNLAPNQLVSEIDASTGGFALNNGQTHGTTNRIMSRNDALTKYSLDVAPMNPYGNNQCPPRNAWVGIANQICLAPAYTTTNALGGDASTFATARSTGTVTASGSWNVTACQAGINFFQVRRAFFGFNTTSITNATSIEFKFVLNQPAVTTGMNLVLVRPTTNFPANHAWVLADYPTSNGGTLISNIVPITQNQTGTVTFQLNATGISYINGTNDANIAIIQYDNDYLNVSPPTVGAPFVAGNNTDINMCVVSTGTPVVSYAYQVSTLGFIPVQDSCNEASPTYQTLYGNTSSLQVNTVLYTTSTLTNGTQYNGGGWYYRTTALSGQVIKIHTSGTIMEIATCAPPPPTSRIFFFSIGLGDSFASCSETSYVNGWYTNYTTDVQPQYGMHLYYDSDLTSPVNASGLWYNSYEASINTPMTYFINSSGQITSFNNC